MHRNSPLIGSLKFGEIWIGLAAFIKYDEVGKERLYPLTRSLYCRRLRNP